MADVRVTDVDVQASLVRRWGAGLRLSSPTALVAVLCASALAPVVAAAVGAGAVAVAGVGVLGSVGTGVLTDVVKRAIESLRAGGRRPGRDEAEDEVAARIEEVLSGGDARAKALRAEVAAVLRETGAVPAAVQAAVASGDRDTQAELTGALVALSADFDEFGFVLADVRDATAAIQETLRRQDAERRADRDRAHQSAVQLRLMRDELAVIEQRTRPAAATGAAGRPVAWEGNPYRGLWPFEEDHGAVFYGRERLTAELVTTLADRLSGLGMLIVTGASGAGKSSLLRGGLMPALARGTLVPGSSTWPRTVITPGRAPLEELATHLAALGGMSAAAVYHSLVNAPDQAHQLVRQLILAGGDAAARLVLVVDQFEDIFAVSRDEEQALAFARNAFVAALGAAAGTPGGPHGVPPALVLLGVRGDFLDRCAGYPRLAEALRAGPFVVGPMSEEELRRAITGPAAAAGLEIEPGLTETILADLRGAGTADGLGGALPLLSQAMLATWEQREAGRLTSRGYGLAGGIAHAVHTSAEAAYAALTPPQQDTARTIMRRLTVVTRDGQLARRRMARADLYAMDPAANVDSVLDEFAGKRLVILNNGSAEIAHDALLRAWPRMRGWLDGDLADRALYSQLIDDAAAWHDKGRDSSFVYRGAQLAAATQALRRWTAEPDRYPPLSPTATRFLAASRSVAARNRRIWYAVAAGLVALTLVAAGAAVAAGKYAIDANRQGSIALSRQLAAESQSTFDNGPVTAWRLAAAAWSVSPTTEARDAMAALVSQRRSTLVGHGERVNAVAFSPDGKVLASGGGDVVRLWDPATGRPVRAPFAGHTDEVTAVAISPDGTMVASGSRDKTVRLWDLATGRTVGGPLAGHTEKVDAVAFSPDGKLVASAANDGTVRLWDRGSGGPLGAPIPSAGPVGVVAFSPDGRSFATVGKDLDDPVQLWDVASRRPVGEPMTGHTTYVTAIAFSPDGRKLAVADGAGTIRLWNPATSSVIGGSMVGHTSWVTGLAFSPDGTKLASAGLDETIRLWDPDTRRQIGDLITGHTNRINAVAFSPDGTRLASASDDHTVRLWSSATGRPADGPLIGHKDWVTAVAISPDGARVASASDDETVRLWDVATGRTIGDPLPAPVALAFSPNGSLLATGGDDGSVLLTDPATGRPIGAVPTGYEVAVAALAFSPDSRLLATAGVGDNEVRLWDVASGRPVGPPLSGHGGRISALAFSPDGRTLASGGGDTVRLWDPATGEPRRAPQKTGPSGGLAFSPDGKTLASADGRVELWDLATGRRVAVSPPDHHDARAVAFSPDGKVLASGGPGNTIRLWDPSTVQPVGAPLRGHDGSVGESVTAIAFGQDGSRLVSASTDHTIRLWTTTDFVDPFAEICAQVGSITPLEWGQFVPGDPPRRVCP